MRGRQHRSRQESQTPALALRWGCTPYAYLQQAEPRLRPSWVEPLPWSLRREGQWTLGGPHRSDLSPFTKG